MPPLDALIDESKRFSLIRFAIASTAAVGAAGSFVVLLAFDLISRRRG